MRNGEQWGLLDAVTLISFGIALQNLDENITQSDKDDLQEELSKRAEEILRDIHAHLAEQDRMLKKILEDMKE